MRKVIFIHWILILLATRVHAQIYITVKGIVIDTSGAPLPGATIILNSSKDSSTIYTKDNGSFNTSLSIETKVTVLITMQGYFSQRTEYVLRNGQILLDLGSISLFPNPQELKAVIVKGLKPITVRPDTLTFNVGSFNARVGDELETFMKRLPGVDIDITGRIIVGGKIISGIMIDGKPFYGGDILMATRNLPIDIIDKIQIIDDYGDKARLTGVKSGDPIKVLNIILKENKKKGGLGNIQEDIGNHSKYLSDIFTTLFSGNKHFFANGLVSDNNSTGKDLQKKLELGYADSWMSKWSAEFSGGVYSSLQSSNGSLTQDNFYATGETHIDQTMRTSSSNRGFEMAGTLTYNPNSDLLLRIHPSLSVESPDQLTQSRSSIRQNDNRSIRSGQNEITNKTTAGNNSTSLQLYIEHLLSSSNKRFSAALTLQHSNSDQNINNRITQSSVDTSHGLTPQNYSVHNKIPSWDFNFNFEYYNPLGKTAYLELGYVRRQSFSHNDHTVFVEDTLGNRISVIDSLSQYYYYTPLTQKIHSAYINQIKKIALSIALDGQQGKISGTTSSKYAPISLSFFSLLPSLQCSYIMSSSQNFSFQYYGTPILPGLQQLQPVTDVSNPQFLVTGRADLRPAYTHNLNFHYDRSIIKLNKISNFGLSATYTNTSNTIVSNIIHPKDSGAVIQKISYMNYGGSHSLQFSYHVNFPSLCRNHFRISISGDMTNNNLTTINDSIPSNTFTFVANQNMHVLFSIPDMLETDLSVNYGYSKTQYLAEIANSPASLNSSGWNFSGKMYFLKKYSFLCQAYQSYAWGKGLSFQNNHIFMTGLVQRQWLKKKNLITAFSAVDILNSSTNIDIMTTSSTITKTQTETLGRRYILSLILKLNRFKE